MFYILTNIIGMDEDVDAGIVLRFSNSQPKMAPRVSAPLCLVFVQSHDNIMDSHKRLYSDYQIQ